LDLFDYFSQSQLSSLSVKDETYDKITDHLDEFLKNMSEKDNQLLIQTLRKCYLKYQDSIKTNANSRLELNTRMLMSILIDQQIQIDTLIK
jgi:hypothetical protein